MGGIMNQRGGLMSQFPFLSGVPGMGAPATPPPAPTAPGPGVGGLPPGLGGGLPPTASATGATNATNGLEGILGATLGGQAPRFASGLGFPAKKGLF
jgi:hypothetical protein